MIRVIKLGGSLLEASALSACLDKAVDFDGQTLIVPGGGLFAEQVRNAQKRWRFDDVVAHHMAVLAMQQMALLFSSLKPEIPVFPTVIELMAWRLTAIWSPQPDELDQAGIAASWDITSDSLAAWLAEQVGADELILVKSATIAVNATPADLQQQGIVDAAFAGFIEHADYKITIINKDRFLSAA
jgi:aspartokinase-like uncharacterized kinase